MHNSSNIIQDEAGQIIPNILRDCNGAILVNNNSAFHRAQIDALRVKNGVNKINELDTSVGFLKTEIINIQSMINLILQKLDR